MCVCIHTYVDVYIFIYIHIFLYLSQTEDYSRGDILPVALRTCSTEAWFSAHSHTSSKLRIYLKLGRIYSFRVWKRQVSYIQSRTAGAWWLGRECYQSLSLWFCGFLLRTSPGAHGSFQARGWMGAAPASLPYRPSKARSEPDLWPKL